MLKFFNSSLGKKCVMAVTGLLLFGFVVAHMLGNLQIFLGQSALNDYAKHLEELEFLLWPARAFLLTVLALHIFVAIRLTAENRAARPVRYAHEGTIKATYASRTMMMSGVIIFLFIVYHLLHFTVRTIEPSYSLLVDSEGRRDVYAMVVLSFQQPLVAISYIVAMATLCFHLSHGLESLFQTLGFKKPSRAATFKVFARVASLVIFIGNSSIPLSIFMGWVKLPGGGL